MPYGLPARFRPGPLFDGDLNSLLDSIAANNRIIGGYGLNVSRTPSGTEIRFSLIQSALFHIVEPDDPGENALFRGQTVNVVAAIGSGDVSFAPLPSGGTTKIQAFGTFKGVLYDGQFVQADYLEGVEWVATGSGIRYVIGEMKSPTEFRIFTQGTRPGGITITSTQQFGAVAFPYGQPEFVLDKPVGLFWNDFTETWDASLEPCPSGAVSP